MTRKNAQARRVEVLGETVRQIRERGMAALRVADVAEATGVSAALIIYHFETKEKLLAEALAYAAESDLRKLGRIMREAGTPASRVMAALEWYAPTGKARGWQLWVDAWSASMRDKVVANVLVNLQDQWTEAIASAIDEGVADGIFVTENSRDAATRLTSMLDGLAVRMLVHQDRIGRGELHAWLARQVNLELGGSALIPSLTEGVDSIS